MDLGPNDMYAVGINVPFDAQGATHVSYADYAAFAEVVAALFWVNITAGARFQHHSAFGPSFEPRLALTSVFEGLHAKLLLSRAFRDPSIGNMRSNRGIRPETTFAAEVKVGYVINEAMYAVINFSISPSAAPSFTA